MAPYSGYLASRAELRFPPRISLAPCKDLLDLGCDKEYQDSIGGGLKSPAFRAVLFCEKITARSVLPIKKASATRPIYSDILPLLVNLL